MAAGIGNGLSQQLHSGAGEEHHRSVIGRGGKLLTITLHIPGGIRGAAFGSRAHIEEVRILQVDVLPGLYCRNGYCTAQDLQAAFQDGNICIASVKVHQVWVEMQHMNVHGQPSFST